MTKSLAQQARNLTKKVRKKQRRKEEAKQRANELAVREALERAPDIAQAVVPKVLEKVQSVAENGDDTTKYLYESRSREKDDLVDKAVTRLVKEMLEREGFVVKLKRVKVEPMPGDTFELEKHITFRTDVHVSW